MNSKKFLSAFMLTMFLFSTSSFAMGEVEEFSDVDYGHDNYNAIAYLKESGVVEGYSDGTFKPDIRINRAEFLKIVMEGSDSYSTEDFTSVELSEFQNCFPDVKKDWFSVYVCSAKKEGLIEGYPDGKFHPERNINFAEASKIIANTLELEMSDDEPEIWFENYVRALETQHAVPKSIPAFNYEITRGDMSEIVWRVQDEPYSISYTGYDKLEYKSAAAYGDSELQYFGNCAELKDFLEVVSEDSYYYGDYYNDEMMLEAIPMSLDSAAGDVPESAPEDAASDSASPDYSETNVQVQGVDEADIVKTDGEYIYVLKGDTVRVVKAYPATEMEELDAVTFSGESFSPADMYVDDGRLVVIGYSYEGYSSMTEVYIFDVNDKENIKVMRELSFEGDYSSSRKVDEMVYLVVNKNEYHYSFPEEWDEDDIMPLVYDSAVGEPEPVTGCGDILYYPALESTQYLIVAGIPIDDAKAEITEQVVLGSSGDIYASRDHMYVAEKDYWSWWDGDDEETVIHKFDLDKSGVEYLGNSEVPGTILNQFSMDEHNGYFRIATTIGDLWSEDPPSTNNLYILDANLGQVGSIEGIAPGEKIYSVRFMGKKAYMVTFKKVDPFFVIDVENPKSPKILGKLKIPGYSDYLHPFDENHIIGFGKEAIDASEDETSARDLDFAWYQGMKVAMFDVSDVANPKELHKVVIGDRGTDSELLHNHKALMFDAEKGLMAFPVTLAEISQSVKDDPDSPDNSYGDYTFQGAYVYDVSIEDGFQLKDRVTHYDETEIEDKSGYYWYGEKDISRILYIGDYLYTISQAKVQANDLDDLDFVDKVDLKD